MKLSKLAAVAILTVMAAFSAEAIAKDLLPLEQGIYVREDVACDRRSNAAVMSFWGDSLNSSPVRCKIKNLKVDGNIYSFKGACTEIRSEETFEQDQVVRIQSKKSFAAKDWDGDEWTNYRWCARKM